jgi:carotenoid cleavage dioxygenase-like enzyme
MSITGDVPAELSGRYPRDGPNPLGLDEPGYRFCEGHWFLGPGMVHGVRLRDGRDLPHKVVISQQDQPSGQSIR